MKGHYAFCIKVKKHLMVAFMKINSGASTHFTSFESNFVNITLSNYSQVETIKGLPRLLY